MSNVPPKRPESASFEQPRADFSWPPTEDELAQYGNDLVRLETTPDEIGPGAVDHSAAPAWDDFHASPVVADEGLPLVADDRQPSRIENSTSSVSSAVRSDARPDGTETSEWTAEIARLQALIDGLTQKVEW